MAYLSKTELDRMGFARLGHNVKISDKAAIYDAHEMEIGDHSRIDDFCVISGRVRIGRNVHIAPLCLVAGGTPGVTLEDFSGLAYHVRVFAQSDDYSGQSLTNPTVPKTYKSETLAAVHIGRHSIVGSGTVVMPGVSLSEGTSVGAMALITKSTTPWGIYVGNPARRLRERDRGLLALETQYLAESE